MTNKDLEDKKLTDFTERELVIAEALGYANKLPVDKNLFDGGCLCHTYPKNSDRACGNHAQILYQIRKVDTLISQLENEARKVTGETSDGKSIQPLLVQFIGDAKANVQD